MRWYHWVIIAVLAIFTIDWAIGTYLKWRERRDLHITAERMRRWNVGVAFRGARAVDKNRFLS